LVSDDTGQRGYFLGNTRRAGAEDKGCHHQGKTRHSITTAHHGSPEQKLRTGCAPIGKHNTSNARNLFELLRCKRGTAICLDNNSPQTVGRHEPHTTAGIVERSNIAIRGREAMKAHSDFMTNHKLATARDLEA